MLLLAWLLALNAAADGTADPKCWTFPVPGVLGTSHTVCSPTAPARNQLVLYFVGST